MKKSRRWVIAMAALLLAAVIGRAVYGCVVVRSLAAEIPQLQQTDTCKLSWTSPSPLAEHIDLTLTGDKLTDFLDYLERVQVTAPIRGPWYQLKGQYYIEFYRQGIQEVELIVSHTGELGLLYDGRWHFYQVQMEDMEEFILPLENWS